MAAGAPAAFQSENTRVRPPIIDVFHVRSSSTARHTKYNSRQTRRGSASPQSAHTSSCVWDDLNISFSESPVWQHWNFRTYKSKFQDFTRTSMTAVKRSLYDTHTQSYTSNLTCRLEFSGTFLKVLYNITFVLKIFTTQTTTKLFVVRVYQLMATQLTHCTKTLCTLTTYKRFHTFMSN